MEQDMEIMEIMERLFQPSFVYTPSSSYENEAIRGQVNPCSVLGIDPTRTDVTPRELRYHFNRVVFTSCQ